MRRLGCVGAACLVLAMSAPQASAQLTNCSTVSQNLFVRDVLSDIYLWYQFLPQVNPAQFPSPEAYLEAVRFRERDAAFSYVTSRASSDAFFSESQFIGYGFSMQTTADALRVLQVFDESPAAEAGLARGDRIVEINGRSVASLVETGEIGLAFGPAVEGIVTAIVFQPREGEPRSATMTKRPVTIPTVSQVKVFEDDGRRIGYVFFRNFVRPSFVALDEAFAVLREAGVSELVLDLRYNGGGLVDVAVHLASLIGGVATRDAVFAEYRHNDRNSWRDVALRFGDPEDALGLSRLVVITTRASASASELVINALRPFMPVTVVGDRTFGKPVGQYVVPFCDKVVAPVSFTMVNAAGEGDFFDGLAPQCVAADDADRELGAADEASLAEALRFIRTGECTAPPEPEEPEAGPERRLAIDPRAVGWQVLVNAQ